MLNHSVALVIYEFFFLTENQAIISIYNYISDTYMYFFLYL